MGEGFKPPADDEKFYHFALKTTHDSLQALFATYGSVENYRHIHGPFMQMFFDKEYEKAWGWLNQTCPKPLILRFVADAIQLNLCVMEDAKDRIPPVLPN